MENCTIGIHCGQQTECHRVVYTRSTGLKNISEFSISDSALLLRRSGFTGPSVLTTVCKHHEQIFLHKYSLLQKSCCDPYSLHPNSVRKKSLRSVDLEQADAITC